MEGPPQRLRILCTNIPEEFWNKKEIREHFVQFGNVVRAHLRPRIKAWVIEFDNTESAQLAILKGGKFKGHAFNIHWDHRKKKIKKNADPDWVPDPEVQKELDAMGSIGGNYNLRPEAMAVDAPTVEIHPRRSNYKTAPTKHTPTVPRISKLPLNKSDKTSEVIPPEQMVLIKILKQPALTLDDRFRVLDARDKLIRLGTKKQLDITEAEHLVGTCPDMCPEKERLMREIQHQVAVYEQDTNGKGMNPVLAVKQYSRSSADQEVPLPHDLRPANVLQLTMEYLMHNVMNLCDSSDVNIAEWYYFLWDRTRGIRKDITQQELCCQNSVILLEQCARFHIHCSARLVAEDVSVFDPKINTENLTKCLQTLKYMYHDLHIKGENCSNESEFRAYIILLNLNDGNFMWEVQQLKEEIQKSPEVRFAINIYSAIDKNNYVRFFKLVHSTTYLNACILFRYFVQVRSKALLTLVTCYSPRASFSLFSLAEFEVLLAFEDLTSAKEFVSSYGLLLNETSTHIILTKKNFFLPLPSVLDRAIKVVESKRQQSVGEIVCGNSINLTLFENYKPSNSFTENGTLIVPDTLKSLIEGIPLVDDTDSINTKQPVMELLKPIVDQAKQLWTSKNKVTSTTFSTDSQFSIFTSASNKTHNESPLRSSVLVYPTPKEGGFPFKLGNVTTNQPASIFGGQVSTTPPQGLFGDIFKAPATAIQSQNLFGNTPAVKQTQTQFTFGTLPPQILEPVETVPTLQLKEQEELMRKAQESQRKLQEQLQLKIEIEHLRKLEEEKRRKLKIEKQLQLELEKKKQLEIQRQKQLELERLRELEVKRQQELEMEMERKKQMEYERLLRIKQEQELERRRLEEERRKHKEMLLLKEQEHKRIEEIKICVHQLMNDLLNTVEKNYKEQRLQEICSAIIAYKQRLFVRKWRDKITLQKKKRQAIDQNPIWLPSRTITEEASQLFTTAQALSLQNIKRYKLGQPTVISIPNAQPIAQFNTDQLYNALANSYMKHGCRTQTDMFWKLTVSLPDFQECHTGLSYIDNILTEYFGWKDHYGTTVVVNYDAKNRFHYSVEKKQGVHPIDTNSNGFLFIINEITDATLKRISYSLQGLRNACQLPIACIIITNDWYQDDNLDKLKTAFETDTHSINYTILLSPYNSASIVEAVQNGLGFLAKYVDKPPPLELNLLRHFLQEHLATQLWKQVSNYATCSGKYKKCLRLPNLVIDLHNQAVEKLKAVVLDDSCLEYQDFCDDFELNSAPDVFPCNYRHFPPFWKLESYRLRVLTIMNALKLPKFIDWPPTTNVELEDSLSRYISEAFLETSSLMYKVLGVLLKNVDAINNFCDIQKASWVEVVELLALEKIQELDLTLRCTEFHTKSVFEELVVVYNVSKLDAYNSDNWFYLKNAAVRFEIENLTKIKGTKKKRQREPLDEDIDLDKLEKSLRGEASSSYLDKLKMKSAIEEIETLMTDLEQSIKIQTSVCSYIETALNFSNKNC